LKRIAGLDDAGRGAIIGPLIIAGVCIREERLNELKDIGVRDSKLLSPYTRERLFKEIKNIVDKYEYEKLEPEVVDTYVKRKRRYTKLNLLEAEAMARVIDKLNPSIAYVDASDVSTDRFKKQIAERLSKSVVVVSVHKADRIFVVVSAASIIAKVIRDREVRKLKRIFGDFGSGYPSDPRTIEAIKSWIKVHNKIPPYTRLSWKTWKRLSQTTLDEI
jgi:ribonuclease HII